MWAEFLQLSSTAKLDYYMNESSVFKFYQIGCVGEICHGVCVEPGEIMLWCNCQGVIISCGIIVRV